MKQIALVLLLVTTAACAAGPTLSDTDKLKVRDVQVKVATLDSQKSHLEAQYREIASELEKSSAELDALVKKLTPEGYVLQADLTFLPKKADPPSIAPPVNKK